MANKYWLITNRKQTGGRKPGLGSDEGDLSYWVADEKVKPGDLSNLAQWTKLADKDFRSEIAKAAGSFPHLDAEHHEDQKHVSLFVHGFNNSHEDSLRRYVKLEATIFGGGALGIPVLFSWPSDGLKIGYYPDRSDARGSADDLATVLLDLYDYLSKKQELAMVKRADTCKAKTSIIAHSMGAYLVQKALKVAWDRKNQPLLLSLINQLLLVSADVDNDLFKSGETIDHSDGDAIANLSYRVTALFTGLDSTLGLSAGFKHFGKRRLGRSGLDRREPAPDNVWDIDVSPFVKGHDNIHSASFDVEKTQQIILDVLRGVDRTVLQNQHGFGPAVVVA